VHELKNFARCFQPNAQLSLTFSWGVFFFFFLNNDLELATGQGHTDWRCGETCRWYCTFQEPHFKNRRDRDRIEVGRRNGREEQPITSIPIRSRTAPFRAGEVSPHADNFSLHVQYCTHPSRKLARQVVRRFFLSSSRLHVRGDWIRHVLQLEAIRIRNEVPSTTSDG
jgi:hypothetical protein